MDLFIGLGRQSTDTTTCSNNYWAVFHWNIVLQQTMGLCGSHLWVFFVSFDATILKIYCKNWYNSFITLIICCLSLKISDGTLMSKGMFSNERYGQMLYIHCVSYGLIEQDPVSSFLSLAFLFTKLMKILLFLEF